MQYLSITSINTRLFDSGMLVALSIVAFKTASIPSLFESIRGSATIP